MCCCGSFGRCLIIFLHRKWWISCALTAWGETVVENLSNLESRHCAALFAMVEATWHTPSHKQFHHSSVVVEALAGLLEVAVAFLCWGEPGLNQVLPVEGPAAQLLPLSLGPGCMFRLDVAGQRDSPGCQTPGQMQPHRHWPGQTQEKSYSVLMKYQVNHNMREIKRYCTAALSECCGSSIHVKTYLRFRPQMWGHFCKVLDDPHFWLVSNLEITVNIRIMIKIVLISVCPRTSIDFSEANTCHPSPKQLKWPRIVC